MRTRQLIPLRDIRRSLNLWDDFFGGHEGFPSQASSTPFGSLDVPLNLKESDTAYAVNLELPGVSKDDISIDLHDGLLTIKGEKRSETESSETEDGQYHYREITSGSFTRQVSLPEANGDAADAEFKDGILSITVPKTEGAKPKPIQIK